MGRSSSAIVLLLVSILAIESHADSPIQNVASIACDDFSNMEYQKICTSLFEQVTQFLRITNRFLFDSSSLS